ncbi:LLM class flavin-dependent oxidoreductase [Streptomyces sp. NPDC051644]|uniref:LLM class flavin-dependent oxidoreductase n=1 Tax=Streptomyces sp. NPDC051644 TaxID=3365666 RepID=UPI0037B9700D
MTRVKIGVQYTPAPGQGVKETVRAAAEIESMGYCCFSVPDHLTRPHQGLAVAVPDPFVLLARLAADTRAIGLGTMTVLDALRLPVQTLRGAVTLQQISGGRFELGIGAGWQQADLDALSPDVRSAPVRINSLEDTLTLLRQAWPTGTPARDDPRAAPARILAGGTTRPSVIVAAGTSRMLQVAARFADTVALTVPTRPRLAGITPTATSVAAQIAAVRGARPAQMPAPGFHLQIRDLSTNPPNDPDSDWWTVGGSPGQIADALRRRADAGVDYLSVCTEDLHLLEWLASHVLPQYEE